MEKRKVKILLLGHNDTKQQGHIFSIWKQLPPILYDSRLVVLSSYENKDGYESFFDCTNLIGKIKFFIHKKLQQFSLAIRVGSFIKLHNEAYSEHFFSYRSRNLISAKDILKKCQGFTPDVIYLGWSSTLVSAKAIRDLYELTHAEMVFNFVDQQHLSGGCHYPVECEGYVTSCSCCPVFESGNKVAELQLKEAVRYLSDMPKIVSSTASDRKLINKSPLFNNARFLPSSVVVPTVTTYSKEESRTRFNIDENEFVIMFGAQNINTLRKGIYYTIEGVNKIAHKYGDICLLILGESDNCKVILERLDSRIHVVTPGFIKRDDLFKAYCASDCYLSTTIADSGPMMVNYSIALGCPVVSFNIGIAQDLIIHKETGYIAEYKNIDSVADGLEYIKLLSERDKQVMHDKCVKLMDGMGKRKGKFESLYELVRELKSQS